MNGYELSRNWFDFAFENNSKITANHGILFFWLIEINNRLGWAKEFQITAKECMQGMGCHSYNTYKKCLDDLIKWEFIVLKRKAVNQFQTNIIALSNNNNPLYKAMDKALTKHGTKQSESTVQSTGDIHKPITYKPINYKNKGKHLFINSEYYDLNKFIIKIESKEKYVCFDSEYYHESAINWSEQGNMKKDWIATIRNWMLRDVKDEKPKLKREFELKFKQNGKQTYTDKLREYLNRDYRNEDFTS